MPAVSAFPAASALDGTELVPVVQGGADKKSTAADIAAFGHFIVVAVIYAATTTVDLSTYSSYATVILDLTLTGNVTFNLTNGTDGQRIEVRVRQDATGSRVWTSGANLRMSSDIPSITLSTAASKLDKLGFEWVGADGKADINATNKGF